jgi:hypothetical protein
MLASQRAFRRIKQENELLIAKANGATEDLAKLQVEYDRLSKVYLKQKVVIGDVQRALRGSVR